MGALEFGEFEADPERFELRRAGARVEISAKCFDVLLYLIRHRERVVSKDELVEKVWQTQALSTSAVPTAILALRKALGDDANSARHIANVRGRGYRFVEEIRESAPHPAAAPGTSDASAIASAGRSNFVGRGSEMAVLMGAFDRAGSGLPQIVLLAGEAGIGKTRTAEEFSIRARARGARVLVGRCREGEGAPAFWPWVQIVRSLLEQSNTLSGESPIRILAPVLAQMVPEIANHFPQLDAPPPLEPEAARFRLFDTVTQLLQRAASERPLVVVLDDLHRADPASLQLVAFVCRELREAKVLVLVAYRDVEAQRDPPRLNVISELARQEPSRAIQLHGLSAGEVAEFVSTSALSSATKNSLARKLYEQSGGNPFFLTQLVHLIEAEGSAFPADVDRGIAGLFPGGIREAIARQLEGLPSDSRRSLRVAAAAGREFSASIIAEVLGVSPSEILADLGLALDARMIVASERHNYFRFAHDLLRDSIYDAIPTSERSALHAQIAKSLDRFFADDLGSHSAELAYHYLEAVHECGTEPAVRFAVLAGESASERLGYEDAARHFQVALRVLEQAGPGNLGRRCELLLALGESELNASERDRAKSTLYAAASHAKRIGSATLMARAALRLAPGFFAVEIGNRDRVFEELLENALAALGPEDSPLRARLLARLAMALAWSDEHERRATLVREAVSVAERVGDFDSQAHALTAKHGLLWEPGLLSERTRLVEQVRELVSRGGDTDLTLMNMLFRITAYFAQGKIEAVDQAIEEYAGIASALNRPVSLWYTSLFRAARALMQGRFHDAERLAREFLDIGQRVQDTNAVHSFGAHICILRLVGGRASELLEMADGYVTRFPAIHGWRVSRAYLYLHSERYGEARAQYERLVEHRESAIPSNEQWAIVACILAEMCVALRDDRNAEWLYRMLLPGINQYCVIGMGVAVYGCIARRLGLLATHLENWDVAEQHFELATTLEERGDSPPAVAQALYDHATMLQLRDRLGDRKNARRLIERGAQISKRLGMAALTRKLRLAL